MDALLIAIYQAIPVGYLAVLWLNRRRLEPSGVASVEAALQMRDRDAILDPIRFLFQDLGITTWCTARALHAYTRPPLLSQTQAHTNTALDGKYLRSTRPFDDGRLSPRAVNVLFRYHEVIDMYRRICFIGVLPLVSPDLTVRSYFGCVLALGSAVYFREVRNSSTPTCTHTVPSFSRTRYVLSVSRKRRIAIPRILQSVVFMSACLCFDFSCFSFLRFMCRRSPCMCAYVLACVLGNPRSRPTGPR